MTFDGQDDWINLGQITSILDSTAISTEFVVRMEGSLDSNDRKIFHYSRSGTSDGIFQVRKGGDNDNLLYQYNVGGTWYTASID
jgi:hypothetical protein